MRRASRTAATRRWRGSRAEDARSGGGTEIRLGSANRWTPVAFDGLVDSRVDSVHPEDRDAVQGGRPSDALDRPAAVRRQHGSASVLGRLYRFDGLEDAGLRHRSPKVETVETRYDVNGVEMVEV